MAATYSPTWYSSTIGASGLNFSVRNGKRWDPAAITTWLPAYHITLGHTSLPEITLHVRQRQAIRPYRWRISTSKTIEHRLLTTTERMRAGRKSRAISSARLWRHRLYTCTLSTSSSMTTLKGVLILRKASRLDAFSAYPYQTQIPGGAPGGTTGKPEVCPSRSSRTSDGTTQNSHAHDR